MYMGCTCQAVWICIWTRNLAPQTPPEVVRMSLKINSEELWTISSNAEDISPVDDKTFGEIEYGCCFY